MPDRTIRALPLWQPWATLVAIGAKRVETRAYPPQRLGLRAGELIAIHACKTGRDLWLCEEEWFCEFDLDPERLPFGALVATCVIDRAVEVNELSAAELQAKNPQEFAFGYYAPGRWAWVLRDVVRLAQPVPFRGSQGTFDVPMDLVAVVA